MSPDVQIAIITYVVPALIFALMGIRRKRVVATAKREELATRRDQIADGQRRTDFDLAMELRDEIREENRGLRQRLTEADDRISALEERGRVLERRVSMLTDLLMRHGITVPAWAEEEA